MIEARNRNATSHVTETRNRNATSHVTETRNRNATSHVTETRNRNATSHVTETRYRNNATSHVTETRNRNNATIHVNEAGNVNQFRKGTSRNSDYVNMLAFRASPDNIVILAMTDFSYVDMAINLYEASFKPHDITNFLFVGTGSRSCEVLANHSVPCFRYADDNESEVANIFQSSGFKRKMNIRTNMILAALRAGFSVLHMDVDVVFLKNPLEELKVR